MAKVFIEESTLVGISDSIRAKTGKTGLIKPGQWASELDNIKSSGKYLWSKKGMVQNDIMLEGMGGTRTIVTANASVPSVEIEYSYEDYEYIDGIYKFLDSTVVTLVNTDTVIPVPSSDWYDFKYVRLTSEPNVIFCNVTFAAGTMNASGTVTKSMTYASKFTYEKGSDILGYTVSDDLAAYPDGAWLDGYYWEMASKIQFTYYGATHYAPKGITWGEWVETDWNTAGFEVSGNYIIDGNDEKVSYNGTRVINTDAIIAGGSYTA